MSRRLKSKAWNYCRHPQCRHLVPKPSMLQRRMVSLSTSGLSLMLKTTRNPEALTAAGRRFNRLLCGVQIKSQWVGGRAWPYLQGGEGPAVVLLHGFGADKDRFGSFLPFIRRAFHTVVPDIPGFGDHHKDWSLSYDTPAQVRRIERFIDAIGLDRFHLMGISLGGYLAAYYTARNSGRVESLCLMDSAGFSSPFSSDALHLFNQGRRNIFLPHDESEMQLLVDHLLHRPVTLPDTLRRYWLDQTLELMPWRQKLFEDLLSGGVHLMDRLADRITVPTLVVWGAEDRICHVSTVDRIMAKIEDCRAYIIHGCGHIPIVEHPRLSAKLYIDFLRRIESRRPPAKRAAWTSGHRPK